MQILTLVWKINARMVLSIINVVECAEMDINCKAKLSFANL